MSEFAAGSMPGFQVEQESNEKVITWSGRGGQTLVATKKATIAASNTDAGNTPSTTLRGGQVLAIADADGKTHLYDPDANDGKQIAVGLLEQSQDMLQNGVATDRFAQMVVHGLVREDQLVGLDARARQQLASRMVFDRSLGVGAGELMHPRGVYRKAADYNVSAADNGLLLIATAAVNFTLPEKENGLAFRFLQTADANLVITGSADMVARGTVGATTITFSTASNKIGSHLLVECLYIGTGVLKWVVSNLGDTTMTIA